MITIKQGSRTLNVKRATSSYGLTSSVDVEVIVEKGDGSTGVQFWGLGVPEARAVAAALNGYADEIEQDVREGRV